MAISFTDYMVALRASGLPGNYRGIALWIATRCANDWAVTRETIVSDSGFSRATVARAIEYLESAGWLRRMSSRKGNRYELRIPTDTKDQSESTEGSQRAYARAQSEPTQGLTESLSRENDRLTESPSRAHSEPTEGSQRAYTRAQSEPIYTRTIQKHKNNKNPARPLAPACTHTREGDAATIKHSNLNEGLLARWVRELVKVPEAKEEILKLNFRKSPGEVYQAMFVTSLYTTEALFERFRPWFVRLQAEGKL